MIVKQTQRGFGRIEFKDRYDAACSLQKSSLASEDCIWFGCDEPDPKVCIPGKGWQSVPLPEDCVTNTRMHLTRQQAKGLLPHLQAFARTGEIEIIPPTKAQLWRKVARLAGELMFASQHSMPLSSGHCKPPGAIRQLIRSVRYFDLVDAIDKKHHEKIIAKLEAALAAWEAAK